MVWLQKQLYTLWDTLGMIPKLPNIMFKHTLSKQKVVSQEWQSNTEITTKTLTLHYFSTQHLFGSNSTIKYARIQINALGIF